MIQYDKIYNRLNEDIYGGTAIVYHRTDHKDLIADLKKGNKFIPGPGDFYGKGMYSTFDFKNAVSQNMKRYGKYIIKFWIRNIDNYLIFNQKILDKTLKAKRLKNYESAAADIVDKIYFSFDDQQMTLLTIVIEQLLDFSFSEKDIITIFNYENTNDMFYHLDFTKLSSSALAKYLTSLLHLDNCLAGIIYTDGLHDGDVLITYPRDIGSLIPVGVSNDEGATWTQISIPEMTQISQVKCIIPPITKTITDIPDYFKKNINIEFYHTYISDPNNISNFDYVSFVPSSCTGLIYNGYKGNILLKKLPKLVKELTIMDSDCTIIGVADNIPSIYIENSKVNFNKMILNYCHEVSLNNSIITGFENLDKVDNIIVSNTPKNEPYIFSVAKNQTMMFHFLQGESVNIISYGSIKFFDCKNISINIEGDPYAINFSNSSAEILNCPLVGHIYTDDKSDVNFKDIKYNNFECSSIYFKTNELYSYMYKEWTSSKKNDDNFLKKMIKKGFKKGLLEKELAEIAENEKIDKEI